MATMLTMVAATLVPALLSATPAHSQAQPQQLIVDLDERTGAFLGGAHGGLYALSDEGVPSDNVLEPLAIRTIAQKPPAGLQHPNGDALIVAEPFFRAGGEYVQIYVQDFYELWPYEDLGIEDYLEKIEQVVTDVVASEHADRFVYAPFNEPDQIWYHTSTGNQGQYQQRMARFLEDWKATYELIRELHPGARILGPNEARYRPRNIADFLEYARDNDVLPDVMAWHELQPDSTRLYRDNYEDYRQIEADLGIDPLPININEWGNRRDLTMPGQMVQFFSMFEDTKVDAGGQAYWDVAGNISGNIVETNKPSGAWWLSKAYGQMSGETVAVAPPQPRATDTLQGLATIDDAKQQARILVGGGQLWPIPDGPEDADIVVRGIDPAVFGDAVHVTMTSTTYSGQEGVAPPPTALLDEDLAVQDGTVTVPIADLDVMAAYEIVLSPGGAGTRADIDHPFSVSYEAEDAAVTSGCVSQQGVPTSFGAANRYATSGLYDVGCLNQSNSSVTFDVEVPEAGRYELSILYGNMTGSWSQQVLRVNGEDPRFVDYRATLNWTHRNHKGVIVELDAGDNQLSFAKTDPVLGQARQEVTLDRIDLEAVGDDAPVTRVYEAERAMTSDEVEYAYDDTGQSGSGYTVLHEDGELTYVVHAEHDGYHDLEVRHAAHGRSSTGTSSISLDGEVVDGARITTHARAPWHDHTERLFLSAGINRVRITPDGSTPVRLDRLAVTAVDADELPVQDIEAESDRNDLAGAASVETDQFASGGAYVGWVGQGAGNRLTLNVEASVAGQHLLVVHYANDDREEGHAYNADIISRPIDFSVNGGDSDRYWFRNTWSWDSYWAVGVPVSLEAGDNTIALYNDAANASTMDSDWAPNLDRFELAPLRIACPEPDQRATVVIGEVDSGVANRDAGDGCTIGDLIDDDAPWPDVGSFLGHVNQVAGDLLADGTIDARERAALSRAAAQSGIGRPGRS